MQSPETVPASKKVQLCRWLWQKMSYVWGTLLGGTLLGTMANYFTTPIEQGESLRSVFTHLAVGRLLLSYPVPIAMTLALLLIVTLLSKVGSREPFAQASSTIRQISALDRIRLLKRLHIRYTQLRGQSLQGVVQVELGLAARPTAIANATSLAYWFRSPAQPDQPLPPQTTIIDVYNQAQEEVLILGEPGSGKSTLLIELAHHLLKDAEGNSDHPVPVLLPLSTWATHHPMLQSWLIDEFTRIYDIPKRLSTQWIEAEMILPLLDGLDEMDEAARPACIAAINTYHRDHLHPLVVCSRTDEYEHAAASERLILHTAVVVQPLSPTQVDAHLATLGKPLAALRTALKKNATLATLATTPLMLQVLMLTYQGMTVRQLAQKKGELEQQVWTAYVQQMIKRKDEKHYPPHRTIAWLHWLAQSMQDHNQTIFLLEDLQPDTFPLASGKVMLYRLSMGLVFGLVLGLFTGLVVGPFTGLVNTLLVGLVIGLFIGLTFGEPATIQLKEKIRISWKRLSISLLGALIFGLFVALFAGLFEGISGALIIGLVAGPALGLKGEQLAEHQTLSPNEGIRRSLTNGLVICLVIGLTFGLIFGLQQGLLYGVFSGLLIGLLFGLQQGITTVIQHYVLRLFLWRAHLFPYRAIPFFEDATTRVLLTRVGGGYSFAHRLLLEYFADLDPSSPSSQP